MKLKYFKLSEFNSPDIESGGEKMDEDFLKKLDSARDIAQVAFVINSGYRTPYHNAKVGGKSNSSHLKGFAADIKCTDSRKRAIILMAVIAAGFNRIGIGKSFIHVDNDPDKPSNVVWLY